MPPLARDLMSTPSRAIDKATRGIADSYLDTTCLQVQNGKDTLEAIFTLPANYLDAQQVRQAMLALLSIFICRVCSLQIGCLHHRSRRQELSLVMATMRVSGRESCSQILPCILLCKVMSSLSEPVLSSLGLQASVRYLRAR